MPQYNLTVDSYTENHAEEKFICSCYIVGSDEELADKEVTFAELESRVADSRGQVLCTVFGQGDETETEPFWDWYRAYAYQQVIYDELEDIINAKEGRTVNYVIDTYSMENPFPALMEKITLELTENRKTA